MPPTLDVDPADVRRLLLIRPRFLGDVCLTLPTLDGARAACPGARFGYLVERESAPLLEGDPRIDELIVVGRSPGARETLGLVRRLRAFAPDVALDLFCNPRTALWCRLSGARARVGYPNKGWRSTLYTHHARPRTLSAVGFHLASLAALGWPPATAVPRLHVRPEARAEAEVALAAEGIPRDAVRVGFHPGARWETRRWSRRRFAALARAFLDAEPRGVALVTGSAGERELVDGIVATLPAGRARAVVGWPIARLVALQATCAAFVCGDTGPLHTAVAAGAPTLGLMSRNRPAAFFPYPESLGHRAYYARVECSPCDRDRCADLRCLERLTVEGAWTILSGMLARPRAGAAL
jgi:ADP-heptose:LPS heptosyltransferase